MVIWECEQGHKTCSLCFFPVAFKLALLSYLLTLQTVSEKSLSNKKESRSQVQTHHITELLKSAWYYYDKVHMASLLPISSALWEVWQLLRALFAFSSCPTDSDFQILVLFRSSMILNSFALFSILTGLKMPCLFLWLHGYGCCWRGNQACHFPFLPDATSRNWYNIWHGVGMAWTGWMDTLSMTAS